LFQTGILKRLPDLTLPHFDAEKVHSSAKAYSFFGIPDALLGIASYSITAALAAMTARNNSRLLPYAIAGKTAFDLGNAIRLDTYAWRKLHACSGPSLLVTATS